MAGFVPVMAGIDRGCKEKMHAEGGSDDASMTGKGRRVAPKPAILKETPFMRARAARTIDVKLRIRIPGRSSVARVPDSSTSVEDSPAGADPPPPVEASGAIAAPEAANQQAAPAPLSQPKWYRLRQNGAALLQYLLDSEVHTFAFSVAANAILSFIPFAVLLYTLANSVFHSEAMAKVIRDMVNYFLPSVTREPNWLAKNLEFAAAMSSRHGVQAFSLVMILISCTGIFLPLEVALNQAWGVSKSRNYIKNQVVAFGLAIIMVGLGMAAVALSAAQRSILELVFFHHTEQGFLGWVYGTISYTWMAICSGAACILFFFSIYWLLPNRRVPWRPVLRASVVVGLIWLASRDIFVAVLPHLDLQSMYGPFFISVGLLMWAYISGLILFAGAQYSVARLGSKKS
jgi:membrane protein